MAYGAVATSTCQSIICGGEELGFDAGVERARANCIATLGLLALICGEHVLGPVGLEDYFETRGDGEYGRDRIPCYVSKPRSILDEQLDGVDRALTWVTHADRDSARFRHGVHLGLRWYLDAARTRVPFECFTSSFLAIEALATQMAGLVRGILGDLPLSQKFELFRQSLNDRLGDGAADTRLFGEARQLRNRLLHGQQTELGWQDATPLRDLVERLLSSVVRVPLPQKVARVYQMDAEWTTRSDVARSAGATGYLEFKMTLG